MADLPERILAADLVPGVEGPEVAPTHLDSIAIGRRPSQRPIRDTAVATRNMLVVAVVHIGNSGESRSKSFAHFALPDGPLAPGIRATRRPEDRFVAERGHDRFDVVAVEYNSHLSQQIDLPLSLVTTSVRRSTYIRPT